MHRIISIRGIGLDTTKTAMQDDFVRDVQNAPLSQVKQWNHHHIYNDSSKMIHHLFFPTFLGNPQPLNPENAILPITAVPVVIRQEADSCSVQTSAITLRLTTMLKHMHYSTFKHSIHPMNTVIVMSVGLSIISLTPI
jgi:hypothetical protein